MTDSGTRAKDRDRSPRRARLLLFLGALAGVALAAAGILGEGEGPAPKAETETHLPEPLPVGAVARVNDRLILYKDFNEVLAMEAEGGLVLDAAAKQRVLDGMIAEELRIQRAVELELYLTDARVRMDLASAVAEAAIARAEQGAPDEEALRDYFEQRSDYFATRGPLRVQQIWVEIVAGNLGDAYRRARAATNMLRDAEDFEAVNDMLGSAVSRPIPEDALHPDDLADYVGRAALDAVLTLQPGEVTDPVRSLNGFRVIRVLERRVSDDTSFEGSRYEVEIEYWRMLESRALEADAAKLRSSANIQQAETL